WGTTTFSNINKLHVIQKRAIVHIHDIRSTCHWIIPQTGTNYGRQMLRFNLPSLLNNLNVD
ncbi:uncharacterized protein LOC121835621, partial [Ixodes scapularis]|uniref:uncharacterized protein LOC121835621 n=1 Tax=Ixodes scapularis TaxID=6945 RepID=UPI001C391BE4